MKLPNFLQKLFGEKPNEPIAPDNRPRILHVGNVANLAFVNARIHNARGYNAHLLAPDFYHFASSPEWQDMVDKPVDRAALGDDWFPDFEAGNVPRSPNYPWVSQGPVHLAINYLHHLVRGHPQTALARSTLDYQRFKVAAFKSSLPHSIVMEKVPFLRRMRGSNLTKAEQTALANGRVSDEVLQHMRRVVGSLYGEEQARNISPPIGYANAVSYAGVDRYLSALWQELVTDDQLFATGITLPEELVSHSIKVPEGVEQADFDAYGYTLSWWKELFSHYDEVVLYGSSAIYGLLTGVRYHAYEHGNIRSIPFKNDALGRLTRLAYDRAESVFITNTDYVIADKRLEFDPDRRFYIPHAFEELIIFDFREKHIEKLKPSPDTVTFFAPARQDWQQDDPSLNKGNDRIVHAMKMLVDQGVTNFKVTFVDWGQDAAATRALISDHGLSEHAIWVNPLPKGELWKAYLSNHAVLDQFTLDAFGGVTYETLALGVRVVTRDDGKANRRFFDDDPPPLLSAHTPEEIADRMQAIIRDPMDTAGVGRASRDWIIRKHSADAITGIFAAAFDASKERRAAAEKAKREVDKNAANERRDAERSEWSESETRKTATQKPSHAEGDSGPARLKTPRKTAERSSTVSISKKESGPAPAKASVKTKAGAAREATAKAGSDTKTKADPSATKPKTSTGTKTKPAAGIEPKTSSGTKVKSVTVATPKTSSGIKANAPAATKAKPAATGKSKPTARFDPIGSDFRPRK